MNLFIMNSAKSLFAMAIFLQAPLSIAKSTTTIEPTTLEESVIYMKNMPPIEIEDYKYGMELDIADVINIEYFRPEPYFCGTIPVQMVYSDSEGEVNAIRYLYPDSSGCSN